MLPSHNFAKAGAPAPGPTLRHLPGRGAAGAMAVTAGAGLPVQSTKALSSAWSVTSSAKSTVTPKVSDDSFLRGLRPAATLAQLFGLLPVAKCTHEEKATFRWLSLRMAYAVCIIVGSTLQSISAVMRMIEQGVNFYTSVNAVFYTTSAITSVVFLKLSSSWADTFTFWANMERSVVTINGWPSGLVRQMKVTTWVLLTMALIEHALSIATTVSYVMPCYDRGGLSLLIEGYFITKYRKTFTTISYSMFRGVVLFTLQVITTFIWNFSDLFIILISMGLGAHFQQLNGALEKAKGQIRHDEYWRTRRETYNALSILSRTIDDFVGPVVIISYASNLYFTCLQLLVITKRTGTSSVIHDVYFFLSLLYLIVRTCVMSLQAANVYMESQKPKAVLFSVPAACYCEEVRRFLMQVSTNSIALSGCNFFSITRSFMLTVAGTIVTYIVILVQFDSKTTEEQDAQPNRTLACTCADLKIYEC